MRFQAALILSFFVFMTIHSVAQLDSHLSSKRHRIAFYAGAGPNYYFNNLVLARDQVNPFNYSFVGRFMWEPEHLLSLGLESGYYCLYNVKQSGLGGAQITNFAIPIQVVISMKFLKSFYFGFAIGRSIILNKVKNSNEGNFNAQSWSLADFTETLGYKVLLNERMYLGGEFKFFYSSKLKDKNLALVLLWGYRF